MRRILGALILLGGISLTGITTTQAQNIWEKGPQNALIHLSSGASFPASAAGLTRLAPSVLDARRDVVGVSYVGTLNNHPLQVEVMMAPTLGDTLVALTAEAKQRMLRLPRAHRGDVIDVMIESRTGPIFGHRVRLGYLDRAGSTMLQEVIVVAAASYLARIVADYPEASANAAETILTDLIGDLSWPID